MKHLNLIILSSLVAGTWLASCSKLKPQSSSSKSTADVSISNGNYHIKFQLPEKLDGTIPKVMHGDTDLLKVVDPLDGCDPAEIEGCVAANSNKPDDPTNAGVSVNSNKPDDPTNGGVGYVIPAPNSEDPTRNDQSGIILVDQSKASVLIKIPVDKAPKSFVDALSQSTVGTALSSDGDPCNDPSCGGDGGSVKGTIDLKVHYIKSAESLGLSEPTKIFEVKANVGKK
jgi:hypothetical protein